MRKLRSSPPVTKPRLLRHRSGISDGIAGCEEAFASAGIGDALSRLVSSRLVQVFAIGLKSDEDCEDVHSLDRR